MFSDEHIRALCVRVINSKGEEFDTAVLELQDALEARIMSDGDRNAETRIGPDGHPKTDSRQRR